ncbi:MAG: hypothetical protein ACM357_05155, partial [Gemmatimonadota bacterium]
MTTRRKDGMMEGRRSLGIRRASLLLGLLAPALVPASTHAQADARVVAAVRQAQEGSGDSARAALSRLLQATPATDSLYPEILFATALISPTAQEMQRNLQRVVVEHALSRWADDALLKLAQLEYASGNLPGTVRQLDRIRSDFPRSDVLGLAAFWAARAHFDLRDERSACRWIGTGLAATPAEATDVRAQLDAFARRCPGDLLAAGAMAAPPRSPAAQVAVAPVTPAPSVTPAAEPVAPDTTPPAPADTIRLTPERPVSEPAPAEPPPAATESAVEPTPAFRVQVVAATTQGAADAAVARLQRLGFPARIAR